MNDFPTQHVPNAPPLPPRPFQGVRNAAYRIIGLPRSPSIKIDIPEPFDHLPRSAQDATTSHRTGLEINTIASNEKGTHALIGGKEIFKTIKVDRICVEDRNLRTAIRSTPTQASGKPRQIYSIDIADVAWARGDCGDYIAAATTSGKIILYDLGHAGLQAALLHEHYRQVHKITFNPHRGNLLLSGSQDGTVRLWDIRDVRTHALQSKSKYGQNDGVRDVKWSPTEGVDFAFSTDSGWIQRWDIRNLKVPKIRIPAHTSTCTSLDWHADGKHLLSAGSDKMVRVWDFSTARRHKPAWELKAPYPITNARWRPASSQFATSYHQPVVHIWDLTRPAMPWRELYHESTDMHWHSRDLLWTVGKDGVFLQSDVDYTTQVIDRRNLQCIGMSPGQASFAVQPRRRERSRARSLEELMKQSFVPEQVSMRGEMGERSDFDVEALLKGDLEKVAAAADRSGKYRLAQMWRVVAWAVDELPVPVLDPAHSISLSIGRVAIEDGVPLAKQPPEHGLAISSLDSSFDPRHDPVKHDPIKRGVTITKHDPLDTRPALIKHDSDESFAFMVGSSSSESPSFPEPHPSRLHRLESRDTDEAYGSHTSRHAHLWTASGDVSPVDIAKLDAVPGPHHGRLDQSMAKNLTSNQAIRTGHPQDFTITEVVDLAQANINQPIDPRHHKDLVTTPGHVVNPFKVPASDVAPQASRAPTVERPDDLENTTGRESFANSTYASHVVSGSTLADFSSTSPRSSSRGQGLTRVWSTEHNEDSHVPSNAIAEAANGDTPMKSVFDAHGNRERSSHWQAPSDEPVHPGHFEHAQDVFNAQQLTESTLPQPLRPQAEDRNTSQDLTGHARQRNTELSHVQEQSSLLSLHGPNGNEAAQESLAQTDESIDRSIRKTTTAPAKSAEHPFDLPDLFRELLLFYAVHDAVTAAQLLLVSYSLLSPPTTLTLARYLDLEPVQVESILATCQDTLLAQRRYTTALALRHVMPLASVESDEVALRGQRWCDVCESRDSPLEGSRSTMLSSCMSCSHSFHTACADLLIDAGVSCPAQGCLCACFTL